MKQIFCVEEDSEVMSSLARIRIISRPLSLFSAHNSFSVDLRCENTEVMPPGKLYSLMSMPREFIEPSYRRADKQ